MTMQFKKHFLIIFGLLMALTGCGGGSSSISSGSTATGTTTTTDVGEAPAVVLELVQALFPASGAKWNDYLAGSHYAVASDTACIAGTSPACIHGGELRVVDATGKTSCTGLSASDALAAFDWACDDSSGSARFISTGLAEGKYLSDLVDFTAPGFKTNSVTVFDNGSAWASTPASSWWSNSFEAAVPGPAINASNIYLLNSPASAQFSLAADKVSLVVAPGVTLAGPGSGAASVVAATGFDYLWFEGSIDATGDTDAIRVVNVRHSTLRNVSTINATGYGLYFDGSSNNRLSMVTASNNGSSGAALVNASNSNTLSTITTHNNNTGVTINASSSNRLTSLKSSNNTTDGIQLDSATNNTLTGITANNNARYGIDIVTNSINNSFSGVTTNNNSSNGIYLHIGSNNNRLAGINTSNSSRGIYFDNSHNNTLLGLTTSNNSFTGAFFNNGASKSSLSGLTASNNSTGVYLSNASDFLISDVASSNNGEGVALINVTNTRFTGRLKTGNNISTECSVINGTNPGLLNSSCLNDVDAGSNATLSTGNTLANSFIGKVTTEDLLNGSDVNGATTFATVNDWSNFDNAYRSWGIDGASFPDAAQQGRWTSGNGRIWDWSLAAADTVAREVFVLPDGSMTLTHSWDIGIATPTIDADCDLIVAGSVHNTGACETTYLKHATEIPGDDIGNDNTLCESGESCLYAPNIGSYQGHGELISAGVFTAGTLTGITLMRFADNGR